MPAQSRSPTSESEQARKRVGKACDRCRQKKSKCDGSYPCSRCTADEMICEFTERKRPTEIRHPRGYVEAMERHQDLSFMALRKYYFVLLQANAWPGEPLQLNERGNPPIHDILERLGVLPTNVDFEEDRHLLKMRHREDEQIPMERQNSGSSHTPSLHDSLSPESLQTRGTEVLTPTSNMQSPSLPSPMSPTFDIPMSGADNGFMAFNSTFDYSTSMNMDPDPYLYGQPMFNDMMGSVGVNPGFGTDFLHNQFEP